MNRFKLIALALPFAMSSAAFAADAASGSEYFHQAAAGKWEVTPGFSFGSFKTNISTSCATCNANGPTSMTDSMFNIGVAGEYGINEMISVGIRLAYQTDSQSYSPDQGSGKNSVSGMTDPVLYEITNMAMGPGALHFGGNLAFSLGSGSYDSTPQSMKASEQDGGVTFTPWVGYDINVGPGIVGGRLSYDLVQTNRKYNDKTSANSAAPNDLTLKGGNVLTLAAFWEMNFQPLIWGVDLGIHSMSGQKANINGVNNGADIDMNNGQTNFFVETYANWNVAPDISILPKIGLTQGGGIYARPGATSNSGLDVTIAARFGF